MAETLAGVGQVFDASVAAINHGLAQAQQVLDRLAGLQSASLGPVQVGEATVASLNESLLEIQRRLARVGLPAPPVQVGEMTTSSVNQALLDIVRIVQGA